MDIADFSGSFCTYFQIVRTQPKAFLSSPFVSESESIQSLPLSVRAFLSPSNSSSAAVRDTISDGMGFLNSAAPKLCEEVAGEAASCLDLRGFLFFEPFGRPAIFLSFRFAEWIVNIRKSYFAIRPVLAITEP